MGLLNKLLRSLLIFGLILAIAAPISGCTRQSGQLSEGTGDSEADPAIADVKPAGEITDPFELERLWQEYIYDANNTIAGTWEIDSAEEINTVGIVRFCWIKYQEENGTANLRTDSEDSSLYLFPLADALKYTERYFNLKTLDLNRLPDHFYNPEKQAFTFPKDKYSGEDKPSFSEIRGIDLSKVMRSEDGTLTVELEHYKYGTNLNRRVESRQTFTLKERADGSLYFVAGHKELVNNNLVTLAGEVKEFPVIDGFDGHLQELYMVGEMEGKLILSYASYDPDHDSALMLLNIDSMKIEKKVDLQEGIEPADASLKDGKLFVRLDDKVAIFNGNLDLEKEIPLPEQITAKLKREPRYDLFGYNLVFFGGYDISADLSKIVYCDEVGVKLVTLKDGKEKLLAETIQPEQLDSSRSSPPSRGAPLGPIYHFYPRFVADEKKVLTTLTGYEWNSGFVFCDLEKGTTTKVDIITEGSAGTGVIRYDTGLLFVNEYWPKDKLYDHVDEQKRAEMYRTLYLDFRTGEITAFKLDDPGKTGYIRMDYLSFVGQNYAAFVTSKINDLMDRASDKHYLNRINLQTLELEQEFVSITAADPHILGVLADGRIVFWYEINPAEKGICVTAPAPALVRPEP